MDRLIPIISKEWYHVYLPATCAQRRQAGNRGNDRRTLFHDADDYRAFVGKLEKALMRYRVERIAYVLMPNHFHIVLMQRLEGSLARMMNAIGTSYAKRYNLRHLHTGHVFQGRYHYTHIPTVEALFSVARYVHLNPVRARLVARPEDWEYSDFKEVRDQRQGVLMQGLRQEGGRLGHAYASFVADGVNDIVEMRRFLFEFKASFNSDQSRTMDALTLGRRTP